MTKSSSKSLLMTTAIAPLLWGSTYVIANRWLPVDTPLFAALVRALPSGLILILLTRVLPKGIWWRRIAILGVLNIGIFFYGLFFAAMHLPGGMAALVMSCQPIIVIFLSRWLTSAPANSNHFLAAIFGITGIGLLVLKSTAVLSLSGMVMGLLATSSMALGVVLTKKWGRPSNMNLLSFTGWQLVFGGVFLLPIVMLCEGVPENLTMANMAGYLYLIFIGTILCYVIWFRGLDRLPATSVSFLGFTTSVSACVLGYVFLGETLNGLQVLGAVGVLVSIWLSNRPTKQESGFKWRGLGTD
ncbi:EamA family transporter [Vibrio marisflavi]|uniref:EamA domain-containing protein n=1 Tax=Vibrio marisflavi CECT 7928 TaxID=634439 RepID=A0ABN8E4Y1_9VIBR|nr:EamA family transporter [Vibrio marisflavi]CAH0539222.1 hypothetical protein VMF7928_01990 [Vibrio marisflavi CECT 7928]